tara:strand:+ start:143 stop:361 length:219 start_codon:yes stop_codon:yes gene_type:complete
MDFKTTHGEIMLIGDLVKWIGFTSPMGQGCVIGIVEKIIYHTKCGVYVKVRWADGELAWEDREDLEVINAGR